MKTALHPPLAVQNRPDAGARQLAADLAHDFNNLLNVVSGYLQLIDESLDEPERVAAYLQRAQKAIEGATCLSSRLLSFNQHDARALRLLPSGEQEPDQLYAIEQSDLRKSPRR